jgi:hypothetical protein
MGSTSNSIMADKTGITVAGISVYPSEMNYDDGG